MSVIDKLIASGWSHLATKIRLAPKPIIRPIGYGGIYECGRFGDAAFPRRGMGRTAKQAFDIWNSGGDSMAFAHNGGWAIRTHWPDGRP